MGKIKFLRRNWDKRSRLGKKRKKKQVWRKPKGRHNKMRERQKGYPAIVRIGYKQAEKEKPMLIKSIKELGMVKTGESIIIGKMGRKKKMEIAKIAKEKKIKILNLNMKKIGKENKKTEKKPEENKDKKDKEKKK